MNQPITALVIMGVAGCGKSSVSQALCHLNGATPIEGDAFHPAANIEKMSAGIPLTDEDRSGWLDSLCDELRTAIARGQRPVLTCSALKLRYRERLRAAVDGLGFVFLELTPQVAADRVAHRPGHFMPKTLIDSQFAMAGTAVAITVASKFSMKNAEATSSATLRLRFVDTSEVMGG